MDLTRDNFRNVVLVQEFKGIIYRICHFVDSSQVYEQKCLFSTDFIFYMLQSMYGTQ